MKKLVQSDSILAAVLRCDIHSTCIYKYLLHLLSFPSHIC